MAKRRKKSKLSKSLKALSKRFDKASRALEETAKKYSRKYGKKLVKAAKAKPKRSKSRRKAKRIYFAAAAGQPPHKDTGALRASVSYEVDEVNLEARVGTNLRYGRHLELGEGVNPHPWLRRAAYESAGKVNAILGELTE